MFAVQRVSFKFSYMPNKNCSRQHFNFYYFLLSGKACALKFGRLASEGLTLKAPNKNCSRRHFNFLLFSLEENKARFFM